MPAAPRSSLGSRRLSASATALMLCPPPICCPCWDTSGGCHVVPPGPLVSLQELQGGAGTWCDVGTQVPRLSTPSCGKGLGSGWWAVAVAGGKGGEPRALAVPPLTHPPMETEIFPRLTPLAPHHPDCGMAAPRVGRGTCKHPFPGSTHSTAQHGREEGLSWPGSAQPDAGALSISLWMYSQAGWEPGAPARSSPQPWEP